MELVNEVMILNSSIIENIIIKLANKKTNRKINQSIATQPQKSIKIFNIKPN